MKDFQEIAEKCLSGHERGVFITRRGDILSSIQLIKTKLCVEEINKYPHIYSKNIIKKFPYAFNNCYIDSKNIKRSTLWTYTASGNYETNRGRAIKTGLDIIKFISYTNFI